MPNVGSGPRDDVMNARQAGYVAGQIDDWELVNREAHHRMKNTLMLLAASVRRDFKRGNTTELSAVAGRFERRIVAFGELYHLLSGGEDDEAISVASLFEPLCEALSEAILEPAAIRCEASIEDGKLFAAQGHRLGLIVSELVTNAAKHAFPDGEGGLIRVDAFNRDGCWCFTVTDNGCGTTGSLQGTGGRILEGLARSIGAQLHCQSGQCGTRVTIMLPALV
jgi:two-component sensor histidine kinase